VSKYWLGQFRHAYKNAFDGAVKDHKSFADHLLAPAIVEAEKYVTETDQELAELREKNAQLLLKLANLDAEQIKERNALKEQLADSKDIETAARKLYEVLRGTMAAQSPTGLALGKLLGVSPNTDINKK